MVQGLGCMVSGFGFRVCHLRATPALLLEYLGLALALERRGRLGSRLERCLLFASGAFASKGACGRLGLRLGRGKGGRGDGVLAPSSLGGGRRGGLRSRLGVRLRREIRKGGHSHSLRPPMGRVVGFRLERCLRGRLGFLLRGGHRGGRMGRGVGLRLPG